MSDVDRAAGGEAVERGEDRPVVLRGQERVDEQQVVPGPQREARDLGAEGARVPGRVAGGPPPQAGRRARVGRGGPGPSRQRRAPWRRMRPR